MHGQRNCNTKPRTEKFIILLHVYTIRTKSISSCAKLKTPKMNDISLLRKRLKIVSKITLCFFHYIYSKILEILKTMTSNCTILFWLPLRIFDSSWFLITLPAWGWRTKDNRRNILLNLIEVKPFNHPVNSRIAMKLSNLQILLLKQVFRKDYRLLLTDCRGLCFKIPQGLSFGRKLRQSNYNIHDI